MAVTCYRVLIPNASRFDAPGAVSFTVQTRSIWPRESNIEALLRLLDPAGDIRAEYGPLPREITFSVPRALGRDVAHLLLMHQRPRVTAMTTADLTLALDFYSLPPDRPGAPPGADFQRTPTGEHMNAAKYGNSHAAATALATDAAALAARHPLMSRVGAVIALPGHMVGPGVPLGLPRQVAARIAKRLQVPDVSDALRRTEAVPEAKAHDGAGQVDTMSAIAALGGEVLLVDDALGQGHTLAEACRAVRRAGAERVYSLVLAKDWTGTRGYRKEDL